MKKFIVFTYCIYSIILTSAQTPSLTWVKGISGASSTAFDIGRSVSIDAHGNVYTTGNFEGTADFDPSLGIYNLTTFSGLGGSDLFISKLDSLGNFVWAKNIGGTGAGIAVFSSALDTFGNIYTTGNFQGTVDFDPNGGVVNLTSSFEDVFISKLDSLGNFVWVKDITGIYGAFAYSIILDESGNIFTTGSFRGTVDFDPGVGIYNLSTDSVGTYDIFISKLDSSGNFLWAKNIGGVTGSANAYGKSIAVDALGNVFTTGYFNASIDFDPSAGVVNLTSSGIADVFISKLDSTGNFVWARNMGGIYDVKGNSIAIDSLGNIYITGSFRGTVDFDPGSGIDNLTASLEDIFISKFDSSGNYAWAKNMGGIGSDRGASLALDANSNVYSTGLFQGTADFDPGAGIFNLTSGGAADVFISKLDSSGNFVWAGSMGGTTTDNGLSITLDKLDNIYCTGDFYGTADFDPGAGVYNLISSGSEAVFIHKMSQGDVTTNLINKDSENYISIYPNPNTGVFNVVVSSPSKDAMIEIYNSMGELIIAEQRINRQSSFELTNLVNGLYFVKVTTGDRIITTKIIKQNTK